VLGTVVFTGRGDAEDTPPQPDWVVISINTPGRGAADLAPGWGAVLHQEFHDLDAEHAEMPIFSHRIFSHDLAREVWAFICPHAPHINGVMVSAMQPFIVPPPSQKPLQSTLVPLSRLRTTSTTGWFSGRCWKQHQPCSISDSQEPLITSSLSNRYQFAKLRISKQRSAARMKVATSNEPGCFYQS
jgi:hypothetical protein